MVFRLRYKVLGGHVHCRMFQANSHTFEKNGDLVFDERSWLDFRERMERADVEVVPELAANEVVCKQGHVHGSIVAAAACRED